jgi:hypothetical protein
LRWVKYTKTGVVCQEKNPQDSNPSVTGSSNTNVPLYPSLEKRGKGRFSQHNFKIPLYPPLPKGDKKPVTEKV